MLYNPQLAKTEVKKSITNYIEFGNGKKPLVILTGIDDGFNPLTSQNQAVHFSKAYSEFGEKYHVYIFGRPVKIPKFQTTEQMADDTAASMRALGIKNAYLIGFSLGGMIAEQLTINYPELVEKLVLTVTVSRYNDLMKSVCRNWVDIAEQGDLLALINSVIELFYSEEKLNTFGKLTSKAVKIDNADRFITEVTAPIYHDCYNKLENIKIPVFVIGGRKDRILGVAASYETAEKLPHSELYIYEECEHSLYEEADDYQQRVISFLENN